MTSSDLENKWICDLDTKNSIPMLTTLKEIYLESLRSKNRKFTPCLRSKLQCIMEEHKNLPKTCLEIACKAFFQILSCSGEDCALEGVLRVSLADSRLGVFVVNGILTTKYRSCMEDEKLAEIVLQVAEFCSRQHSIFILWALRNLVSFCKLYPDFGHDTETLLRIMWMNLTTNVSGGREQNLFLLEFVTKNHPERSKSIFQEVLTRWSWMNPYKYYVLGVILTNATFKSVTGEDFNVNLFLEGLSISLKHRNLLSPGQFLFKSLMKHPEIEVSHLVRRILVEGSFQESDNFINQWLYLHPNLDELFAKIDFNLNDIDYEDYIPIRRAFREQLAEPELAADNESFKDIGDSLEEPILQQHYYEILIHRLTKGLDLRTDLSLLNAFLNSLTLDTNTGLRQYIFKRFPVILDQLARRFREEPDEIMEFFSWMQIYIRNDYIEHLYEYQPVIFSLRLLETILKFFSEEKRHQLMKNSNISAKIRLREFLAERNLNFASKENYHLVYVFLMESSFDDIQELACEIITEFFSKEEFRGRIRESFQRNLSMRHDSIESATSCHFYARILSRWDEDVMDRVEESLRKMFKVFIKDPFASAQNGNHIFHIIDCLTECVENKAQQGERLSPLVDFCAEIAEEILKFLNHTGEFEEAPSFEVMEESLQVLIDRSTVQPTKPLPEARKQLLLSLWMTLRACGDFSAASVKILMQNPASAGREIETCLRTSTMILQRCRHKGAIEAAGLSLGRIVREISNQKTDVLIRELENLLAGKRNLSTTRRGAGYSIMLLNLIRNDASDGRRLLQRGMEILLSGLRQKQLGVENYDNLEAVMLHYLCVLVKDSSLTEDMMVFVPEILLIAFRKIDSEEWTVRNGALQLCGALIPKIVGQKMHFQEEEDWQPVKLSVDDLRIRLADINAFLLATLTNSAQNSNTLLITILELLSRIEFWWTEIYSADNILAFRAVLWGLLQHPCHKIRLLSARCFSGFHEFHQIPAIVFQIIKLMPQITEPNFFDGLLMATDALTKKYKTESFAIPTHSTSTFLCDLQDILQEHWSNFPKRNFCPFMRINLKKFLQSVESDLASEINSPEI